jgi:hypothetical protein
MESPVPLDECRGALFALLETFGAPRYRLGE